MTERLSPERKAALRENYLRLTDRVGNAAAKRGKPVKIVAASKTMPAEDINYVASLGLTSVGENRVQELLLKYDVLSPSVERQFIGRLQTNKVRQLIGRVTLIQSLDSVRLAREIERRAAEAGIIAEVLCELNVGREADKGGILAEQLDDTLGEIETFPHIRIRGMMVIGPVCADSDGYKKIFSESYKIFIDNFKEKRHNENGYILSMGMSDSYETAIECGADIIRPGSAIFGHRSYGANT